MEKTLIREHEKLSIKIFKRHGAFQMAVCHLAHFITHRLVQFSAWSVKISVKSCEKHEVFVVRMLTLVAYKMWTTVTIN